MAFLRGLLWFVGAVVLIAVAMYITGNFEMTDRLWGLFLQVQPFLPVTVNFDSFLLVLTVFLLLVTAVVIVGGFLTVGAMAARLAAARQRELAQATAAKREISLVNEERQDHYAQLHVLGQTLAKRLDKRVLVQAIIEAASRVTSVGQANSVVSCWLLHLESDTIRFEMGRYCDQTLFTKSEFLPTEQPFAQAIATQKPLIFPKPDGQAALVQSEKMPQLSATSGMLVVPMVIEDSALGFLVVHCHPDVLKGYDQQQPFYDAMWAELTLALAIAIQGEVAILDRLTGVHNREYFMKRLIQEVERANRFQFPLSLLMIDIDDFKAVNDTLGHPQGDAVLKIISKLLKREIRAIDLAGRYGGEEFIVMLPETGYGEEAVSSTGALVVAERIRKAVDEEFHGMQKPLNLTVSVGVAVRRFPQDRHWDYQELVRLADEQLYRAKTAGKNKVCALQPEDSRAASSE